MPATYIPFNDHYRVPAEVRVSCGVVNGNRLFLCGQMDLDADGRPRHSGDLWSQILRAMELVYEVVAEARFQPRDVLQLQVFYRGSLEHAQTKQRIRERFPGISQALILLTPAASFPMPGADIEIDAIVIGDQEALVVTDETGDIVGARRGDWAVTAFELPGIDYLQSALRGDLATRLGALELAMEDLCKVTASFSSRLIPIDIRTAEDALKTVFARSSPVYHGFVSPDTPSENTALQLEVTALKGGKRHTRPVIGTPGFSAAIRCDDVVFVGAQLALDDDGELAHVSDLAGQTHLVMQHLERLLRQNGLGLANLAKVNAKFVGHDDLEQWRCNVGIRSSYYVPPGPASTGIEVLALPLAGAKISVDCVAID